MTWRTRSLICFLLIGLFAVAVAVPALAKDYPTTFQEALAAAKKADIAGVLKVYEKSADKEKGKDRLLSLYEIAAMYQMAGDASNSEEYFQKARELAGQYDLRAKASGNGAGRQVAAVLTNDRALMYYGRDYERVMAHTLNAINYLLRNDLEGAAVEIRKVDEYQSNCREKARRAAEQAREKQGGQAVAASETTEDDEAEEEGSAKPNQQQRDEADRLAQNSPVLSQAFAPMDQFAASVHNSYENAFTYYLSGVVYEAHGDKQGFNDAVIDLKKAHDLSPGAPAINAAYLYNMKQFDPTEYAALAAQLQDKAPEIPATDHGTLVVLYEAGLVPQKQEFKVDLPIGKNMLSFAFPYYTNLETNQHELAVLYAGQNFQTVRIVDMRPLVVKALVEQRRGIVTRAIARAIAKGAITNEAGKRFGTLGSLAGMIFTAATNRADLRSWYSLPAEVRAARLYLAPGEQEIELSAFGASRKEKVTIQPGAVTLVVVRAMEGFAQVKQVCLKKRPASMPVPANEPALASSGAAESTSPGAVVLASPGATVDLPVSTAPALPVGSSPELPISATTASPAAAVLASPGATVALPVSTAPALSADSSSGSALAGGGAVPTQNYAVSAPGKYLRKGKNSDFLELGSDGTCSLLQDGHDIRGNYKVEGDILTFTSPQMGAQLAKARIIGDTIVDDDGIVWERQAGPQTPAKPTAQETPPGLAPQG